MRLSTVTNHHFAVDRAGGLCEYPSGIARTGPPSCGRVPPSFSRQNRGAKHRPSPGYGAPDTEHRIDRKPRIAWHSDDQPSPYVSGRSEEHTSELQSLMRISYAVFRLKKKKNTHIKKKKTYTQQHTNEPQPNIL